ncbi:MAG: PKD domain-containing protein, partial [Bryobacterales bacterium]|nr:PKD domain-containing protein [Bryobacterales bacterium]
MAAPPAAFHREMVVAEARAGVHPATVEGVELAADDGSPDGRGLLQDGLTVAVRLTPLSYPARLTAIRIYFVGFMGQPSPVGSTIRLIAFVGPGPRPAPGAKYVVDQQVKVPSTGGFADFPIENGPEIQSGDFFVGYQAPQPAAGVGFGTDTEGAQSDRTYWLDPGEAAWGGPLRFTDNTKANATIRARVSWPGPGAGDYELRTDDGTAEVGFLRDGYIYANRLTPPKYPAKLKKVRIWVQQMTDQPEPDGKSVSLFVFRDPEGKGVPPDNPKVDLASQVKLGAQGKWTEVSVDGPVIESGDVYVGFKSPEPHNGVAFAIDSDGQPYHRIFRSRDGGATFTGPIVLTAENNQTAIANLMVRAVVSYGNVEQGEHTVSAAVGSLDVSEGGTEQFQAAVRSQAGVPFEIAVAFDPPAAGLSATVQPATVRAGEPFRVTVRSEGPSDVTSGQLVITATDGTKLARTAVPVYTWREIAAQDIGTEGGVVEGQGVSVRIPAQKLSEKRRVRLLTGKPVTGLEESLDGGVFRVDGMPDGYKGGLEIRLPVSAAAQSAAAQSAALEKGSRPAGEASGTAVLQFMAPDATGKLMPVQQFQPAVVQGNTAILNLPAGKPNVSRRFSLWMLKGWLNLVSAEGNFIVFYRIGYTDSARWVLEKSEKALTAFAASHVDINVFERISTWESLNLLGFPVHPIRITLDKLANPSDAGISNAGQIRLNQEKFKEAEGRDTFRSAVPHEIMHIVEDLFGSGQGVVDSFVREDPRRWMDESLSVWFEPSGLWEANYTPANMSENLAEFLRTGANRVVDSSAREYGYGASSFLTYLGRNVDSRIPKRWLETRDAGRAPWAALIPLIGGDGQLAKHWRDFTRKLFLGQVLPNSKFPDVNMIRPLDDARSFDLIKQGEQWTKTWPQAKDLSVEFFALNLPKAGDPEKMPDLTDVTALGVQVLDKFDDVDVFVYGRNGLLAWREDNAEIVLNEPAKYRAEVPLVVAVVNNHYDPAPSSASRRDIRVKMGLADPKTEILPPFIGQRVIGRSYDFTTRNVNVPADATYQWDFGDGKTATGRNAKQSWSRAGTYRVTVTAEWQNKKVSTSVMTTVAPDTPVVKAEVLFDVFRLYKNPVGQSFQKCNDYAITITDPSGRVAESG